MSTFLIGCIPNFSAISYAAPVLLITCVLAQGLSKGGQVGAIFVYIYESAPNNRRALWISLILVFSFGAFSCTFVKIIIDAVSPDSYGWRIAMWIGITLWPIACYSKYALRRTSTFEQMERDRLREEDREYNQYRNPFSLSLCDHSMLTLTFIGSTALSQGYCSLLYIFLPFYLSTDRMRGWSDDAAYEHQGYMIVVTIVVVLVSGFMTDKYSAFPLLVASAVLTIIGTPFIWYVIHFQHVKCSQTVSTKRSVLEHRSLIVTFLQILFYRTIPCTF